MENISHFTIYASAHGSGWSPSKGEIKKKSWTAAKYWENNARGEELDLSKLESTQCADDPRGADGGDSVGKGGQTCWGPLGWLGPQCMCLWRKGSWKQAVKGEAQKPGIRSHCDGKIYPRSVALRTWRQMWSSVSRAASSSALLSP